MSKQLRGKNLRREIGWRGTCPVCQRPRVKLGWTAIAEDGTKLKVCKICGKKPKVKHK